MFFYIYLQQSVNCAYYISNAIFIYKLHNIHVILYFEMSFL